MVVKILVALSVIFVIVVAGYYLFHKTTDKELIYKKLQKLVLLTSKEHKESAIEQALKHDKIADMFANPCSIDVKEAMVDGFFTPLELASNIIRSRQMVKSVTGSLENVKIHVSPDKQHATVDFTAYIHGTHKDGKNFVEARDLKATLRKIDKQWKFSSFEIREVLEQ